MEYKKSKIEIEILHKANIAHNYVVIKISQETLLLKKNVRPKIMIWPCGVILLSTSEGAMLCNEQVI